MTWGLDGSTSSASSDRDTKSRTVFNLIQYLSERIRGGNYSEHNLVVKDWRQLSGEVELTYDNWRQADVRADENCFFLLQGSIFFGKK